jgi:DNA-binding MarR family transcriptional regulator
MRGQFPGSATGPSIVLENALAFWVNRFYEVSRRAMYREFRTFGVEITPEQWLVLVRLWERDDRPQRELAGAIGRDAPTTSRIVDAMERAKLVSRVADPGDARSRRVRLSAKARALRQVLVPVVKKMVAKMEHGVTERDLEITRQTLQRLTANLG